MNSDRLPAPEPALLPQPVRLPQPAGGPPMRAVLGGCSAAADLDDGTAGRGLDDGGGTCERGGDGDGPADDDAPTGASRVSVRLRRARESPLVRRVTGYSAGSVIAAFTSELAFAAAFGWLHSGTTWASLAGFVGGAIPNYILNRRWAWQGRNGRSRRSEITLYATVSVASFLVSAVVTELVERWARTLTQASSTRVVLVAAAYLGVSGVFFVGKFAAYELIVFTKGPGARAGSSAPSAADATTSTPPPG